MCIFLFFLSSGFLSICFLSSFLTKLLSSKPPHPLFSSSLLCLYVCIFIFSFHAIFFAFFLKYSYFLAFFFQIFIPSSSLVILHPFPHSLSLCVDIFLSPGFIFVFFSSFLISFYFSNLIFIAPPPLPSPVCMYVCV